MDDSVRIDLQMIDVAYVKYLRRRSNFNISKAFISRINNENIETTLAYNAVNNNNEELLDYLIDANVDLDVNIPHSGTALHLAASKGNLKFVKKLLESGANINPRKADTMETPLIEAVLKGNFEIAQYLVENGADVHAATTVDPFLGHTALLIATSKGYNDIAELLLKNGADPCVEIEFSNFKLANIKNILSNTPGVNVNTIFICKNPQDHYPTTLAHLAVAYRHTDLLDYLISAKADLNISIPGHGTVLNTATANFDLNILKKLCDSGANINVPTGEWSLPPLIYAVNLHCLEIVNYFIDNGVDVNATAINSSFHGLNALHIAVKKGYTDLIELMLENNADPNTQTIHGWTPIMYAFKQRRIDIFKIIVAHGGVYDGHMLLAAACDADSSILLDHVLTIDLDKIDRYFTDEESEDPLLHCIIKKSPMQTGFEYRNYQNIKVLLDAGVGINSVNSSNELAIEVTNNSLFLYYVKRHIVRLKQAGIYVCPRNLKFVEKGFHDFHTECHQEILKLKNVKIGTSPFTFYEALRRSFYSLAIGLRNTYIFDIVNKNELITAYPIYGGMIYYKLAKTQRRIELLERVEEFIDNIFNYHLKLPYTFIRELYLHLTNENLRKLTK